MELVVFDLDGTLLNRSAEISTGTRDTLAALADRGIAYTVATGRSLHASRHLLDGHGFTLPHVFKNGVIIWDPMTGATSNENFLTLDEVEHVLKAILAQNITPFVATVESGSRHAVYHPPVQNRVEANLVDAYIRSEADSVDPIAELPADADISNISAIGSHDTISRIAALIEGEPHLVAYSGDAWEGNNWAWIDIHHTDASKGGAVNILKSQLGVSRVVCFGDGANDLSMFAAADEAYAPANADETVRAAATAIIGHHDEDGVAEFLRERFSL
ncbi:MAG: HAD family hydrolase [Pseudomonadota bacterium]